ncbi:MAG TPA: S-adenosylmethionine:tRNA ribosyltransferase-isomerase [Phnomibacter sp.]|nr:S-adenosylmethionine:tRNA ribosyltransferase-isomerase [Phnomibacter sp.]
MHPRQISIADYTYELPDEKIARYPLEQRDASKLLVYQQGEISTRAFRDVAEFLPQPSLLVFNNSKVVAARLLFEKASGGLIEVFALEPHEQYPDITTAMLCQQTVDYKCLVGGASKWKAGLVLQKNLETADGIISISASMLERRSDCFVIRFEWQPASLSFAQVLTVFGQIPIPPYLQRQPEQSDIERYQTLYALNDGSVAAPTAGLHFSPAVFESLAAKQIQKTYVTLHVGAGTFKPVKAAQMQEHEMHAEFLEVDIECIDRLLEFEQIIPVGTTSMRTIESLYWMGVKASLDPDISAEDLQIHQWTVYDELLHHCISKADALKALRNWILNKGNGQLMVKTQIMIAPGYPFKICRGLVTNFHQPNSTLLLLVAAFVGSDWRKIYQYALASDFRFLSYGDSCLLLPHIS